MMIAIKSALENNPQLLRLPEQQLIKQATGSASFASAAAGQAAGDGNRLGGYCRKLDESNCKSIE